MSQARVMVFIDGSNLFWACRALSFKIDLKKLVDVLVKGRSLLRPCYYCAVPDKPDQRQVQFHRMLKHLGFRVVTKTLKTRIDETGQVRHVEKGVDVALVTEMLSMAFKNAYDVAILVSGDDDYIGAVEEIKSMGKRVEIASFEHDPNKGENLISADLKMSGDLFTPLESVKEKIS
jgi:uncharacterized LabA/DUF88 family protein